MTSATVDALAALVKGRVIGDGKRVIAGVADLRLAGPQHVGFVRDPKYRPAAAASKAGALITSVDLGTQAAQIVVSDVNLAYAKVAGHFHPVPRATQHSVHPTAVVDPEAKLASPVDIGPHAVIGKATIGAGSVVMAGVAVGDGVELGAGCVLYPKVTLYPRVRLGARVVVHANTVIGSDGFGYAREGAVWTKIPQLGGVVIGDDCEIGANVGIDRGALGDTRIGPRTKIDNLCHVAHNCQIGEDVVIAAGGMFAGSTSIGDRVTLAGHVVISGHMKIAADVRLGGATIIVQDVPEPGDYMGYPTMEKNKWLRTMRVLKGLVGLRQEALARLTAMREAGEEADEGESAR